jgi:aarF domain-containing kinase
LILPSSLKQWAHNHENAASQAKMIQWTVDAMDALFDVHGYQIFNQGLFNADCHPGNIILVTPQQQEEGTKRRTTSYDTSRLKLGLIDYGQCKRLDPEERKRVARLLVSVANNESDEVIASRFRDLGIQTKNDSTWFLSQFAKLMFGPFQPQHLQHSWHKTLHKADQVVYFPNELSMVYRTSLLLRGLAMSLQINVSVGEKWRHHAQAAMDKEED